MATNNQPTGLQIVTDTTGFVESKGPLGPCFEWYMLVNGVWKATHILHDTNWLLKTDKCAN